MYRSLTLEAPFDYMFKIKLVKHIKLFIEFYNKRRIVLYKCIQIFWNACKIRKIIVLKNSHVIFVIC